MAQVRRLLLIWLFLTLPVSAAEISLQRPLKGPLIIGLDLINAQSIPVQTRVDPKTRKTTVFVIVQGKFIRKDWKLVLDNKRIPTREDGSFEQEVIFTGPAASLPLYAVGPTGKVEPETLELKFPEWQDFLRELQFSKIKRFSSSAGLGASLLSYSETGQPDRSELGLTVRSQATYWLTPQRWQLGLSGYFTALPIAPSVTAPGGFRFFGLNGRIGYSRPLGSSKFTLSILTGVYFTTMLVPDAAYGFTGLSGPQLYPTLRYDLPGGDSVAGYLKFSPVGSGFALLSLSTYEMALGGGYSTRLKNGHYLTGTFDLAYLNIEIGPMRAISRSATLGFAYSF